jgi:hypothetical protein
LDIAALRDQIFQRLQSSGGRFGLGGADCKKILLTPKPEDRRVGGASSQGPLSNQGVGLDNGSRPDATRRERPSEITGKGDDRVNYDHLIMLR